MSFRRGFLFSLISVFCITLAFFAGYFVHDRLNPNLDKFPILDQAYKILINHSLIDPPVPPTLEYGMIRGMVEAFGDPYTLFVEPVQHELETNSLEGRFGGIGVQITRDADGNVILLPFPESPASKAGVLEGDRLIAVDGLTITPETPTEDIQAAIRGPEGKRVQLTVTRAPDFDPIQMTIEREMIPLPSVTWHLDLEKPQLGIIKINAIAASTPDEIQSAVADLERRGATHFVLDLRDNGGGLLTTGIDTARLFLTEGVILQQQYRGQGIETFKVDKPGPLANIPLAVLVNHGTASAAEIIAGSLQANQRAPLVGSDTFGKDTIQLVFDLDDGSSLHVTAGKWWIPDAQEALVGNGLHPDVSIATDESDPNSVLRAASQYLLGN
jgi:carboxyl-terminal processing protease